MSAKNPNKGTIDITIDDIILNPTKVTDNDIAVANEKIEDFQLKNQELTLKLFPGGGIYDVLTNVFKKNYLDNTIIPKLEKYSKKDNPISVAFMDIDNFKKFNDTYGHVAGDYILKETARIINENTRQKNIPFIQNNEIKYESRILDIVNKPVRYGGEEFVNFYTADINGAEEASYRIKEKVENHKFIIPEDTKLKDPSLSREVNITISTGVTQYMPGKEKVKESIQRADNALYHSKENGRNKVSSLAFGSENYKVIGEKQIKPTQPFYMNGQLGILNLSS